MKREKVILLILASLMIMFASCSKESIHGDGFNHSKESNRDNSSRVETPERRNVLILYSAGFNSISDFLSEDIKDLQNGWLPGSNRNNNVLLVYSHATTKRNAYSVPNPPSLTRIYHDLEGNTILDTLVRYPAETHSATAEQLHNVLTYIKENFPANSYGMIFSSHATGYLPSGFYSSPYDYIYKEKTGKTYRSGYRNFLSQPVPYVEPQSDPTLPAVKSIGQDQVGTPGDYLSYEIELDDFADAIPMYIDYILFDACLMGGIEVAYELKDKCRHLGFSQTEVLAEGFNYQTLTTRLIGSETPNPQAVCEDYFHQYEIQSGVNKSATISMVDCSHMESMAAICKKLFDKYGSQIGRLDHTTVQRFFRSSDHWFYDLKDIITKAGATEQELEELQSILDDCIVYKAATPSFMQTFDIKTYSGLSMYLPSNGNTELDKYYKTLSWNKATGLVK